MASRPSASGVEHFGTTHQADRAERAAVGDERHGHGHVRAALAVGRRQLGGPLAHGAGIHGRCHDGAFVFREIGGLQQARFAVLEALLTEQ